VATDISSAIPAVSNPAPVVSNPAPAVPDAVPALPQVQSFQAWLARLGLSGKLLAIGGVVGVVAVLLPLLTLTTSVQMPALGGKGAVKLPAVSSSQTMLLIQDWRGVFCLLGYFAAIASTVILYPPNGLSQKPFAWAGIGIGGVIALLAIWLLILAVNGSSGFSGFGASIKVSVGFGAILNLLTGATVAAGGILKAREEQLF
jgi:hypothetical protein